MADTPDPMAEAVRQQVGEMPQTPEGTPPPRRTRAKAADRARSRGERPASDGATAGTTAPPQRSAARSRTPVNKTTLEQYFATLALIPATMGDSYSAQIISTRAGYLAESYAELAKQSPAVRKVLEAMMSGGAWGGAVMATLSIAIPIAGHYGLFMQVDPWEASMPPVSAKQGQRGRRVFYAPPAQEEQPQGVVTVPPGMAEAFQATMGERGPVNPPTGNGNGAAPSGGPIPNSGPGTEPGDFTAPVAPDAPPGVITVAAVNAVSQAQRAAEHGSAAPSGGGGADAPVRKRAARSRRGKGDPTGGGPPSGR